jgi:hypothetical protein
MSTPGNENTASFQSESGIFGEATFNEDLATTTPRISRFRSSARRDKNPGFTTIPEEPASGVIQPVSLGMRINTVFRSIFEVTTSNLGRLATYLFGLLHHLNQHLFPKWATAVLLLLAVIIAGIFNFTPFTHSVGQQIQQWIPFQVAHPISYFNDRAVYNLEKRMFAVENDLTWMKKKLVLHDDALKKLERLLPDDVYASVSDSGKAELPRNIWSGMVQKFGYTLPEGKSDTVTRSDWEDFLAQNEAKVKAWQAESSEDIWNKHLHEALREGGLLIPRAEVMQIIHKKWDESQNSIKEELKKDLAKLAEIRQGNQRGGITAPEARAISREVFNEMYRDLQVKALGQSQASAYQNLRSPNFFSYGMGAVINPGNTSPTFDFSVKRSWFLWRAISWMVGYGVPPPKVPAVALTKWDEAGDCWCSPMKGTGPGVQLGVMLSYDIYPSQIVIEHVPKSATLDSSATPKEMELLAKIKGTGNRRKVSALSMKELQRGPDEFSDSGYLVIGTFRYDINGHNNVQHFTPDVDLKLLKVSSREFVLRVTSNWGNPDYTCLYRVRLHGEHVPKPVIA